MQTSFNQPPPMYQTSGAQYAPPQQFPPPSNQTMLNPSTVQQTPAPVSNIYGPVPQGAVSSAYFPGQQPPMSQYNSQTYAPSQQAPISSYGGATTGPQTPMLMSSPGYLQSPTYPSSEPYQQYQEMAPTGYGAPQNVAPTPHSAHHYPPLPPAPTVKHTAGWNDPPPISKTSSDKVNSFSASSIIHKNRTKAHHFQSVGRTTSTDSSSSAYGANSDSAHVAPQPSFYDPVQVAHQQQEQSEANAAQERSRSRTSSASEPVPEPQVNLKEEDEKLYKVFENLYHQISALPAMQNPNQRRKLEIAHGKVIHLKMMLSGTADNGTVSETTRQGLNSVAGALAIKDYGSANQLVTHLAASSAFGETSSFLPGVKSLIHIASQYCR